MEIHKKVFLYIVLSLLLLTGSCFSSLVKETATINIAREIQLSGDERTYSYVLAQLQRDSQNIHYHVFFQNHFLEKDEHKAVYIDLLTTLENNEIKEYLTIRMLKDKSIRQQKLKLLAQVYQLPQIHFDLAQIYYDNKEADQAMEHINVAIEMDNDWALAYELKAFILLLQLNWSNALDSARYALELDNTLIKPHFFEAANYLLAGQYLTAIKTMKKVQKLHPYYSFNTDEQVGLLTTYWRELLQAKEMNLPVSGLAMAQEALTDFADQSVILSIQGEFAFSLGMNDIAEKSLKESLRKNPFSLRAVKVYRKLLFKQGKYQEAYDIWAKIVPLDLIFDEKNKVSHRYKRFRQAIVEAQQNNTASLLELAEALKFIGWEKEALIVYEQIGKSAIYEIDALKSHISFLIAMRKYVIKYYETRKYDIVSLLLDLKGIAAKYGIFLQTSPSKEFDSYFLIVREVDPFTAVEGTLGDYLRKYNKFFDMGNNYGQIEFRLMNFLSHQEYERVVWGKNKEYHCILGDETFIDSFSGHYSGAPTIAGRAFLSNQGFYIAADTVRPNLGAIQEIYLRVLEPEPMPEQLSLEDKKYLPYIKPLADAFLHAALHSKIIQLSTEEDLRWQQLFSIILQWNIENVHNHEFGHINDLPCFMPISSNLGRHLGLLWKYNFSPEDIQMRFEHVAEIFGIAHTPHVYYYLFQEMERLNTGFDGIFTMVYWAWYGRLPNEDPYYRSASKIFLDLTELHGKKNWETLKSLPFLQEEELRKLIYDLCHIEGIDIRCDCE